MKKRKITDDGWNGDYMEAKISKLEEQFSEIKNIYKKSDLFYGISIYVNGYTKPSSDELKRIMMTNGGTFHHYERSNTTFIIASNLPDVKIRLNTDKIINPNWVVDCLKKKKILDYSNYLLYTNQKTAQPKITFEKPENINSVIHQTTENIKPKNDINQTTDWGNIINELNILNQKMQTTTEISKNQILSGSTDNIEHSPKYSSEIFESLEFEEYNFEKNKKTSPPIIKLSDSTELEFTNTDIHDNHDLDVINERIARNNASTAVNPNFLSDFYNKSRLHHISSLAAKLKQHVLVLRENHSGNYPSRDNIKKLPKVVAHSSLTTIVHIDMDCFFVSVGLRSRSHLRGFPCAVTHYKDNGSECRDNTDNFEDSKLNSKSEIASCSYEARKRGVKNGMFVGTALKLCPNLKTIPYEFSEYSKVAQILYDTVAEYTVDIEAVSCDEMFVDLTELLCSTKVSCMKFITHLRNTIKSKTNCPCSVGIGSNRLQARLATKKAKPDGQFYLAPPNIKEFMSNTLISDLPGVGYNTAQRLSHFNWKYCSDLQEVKLELLKKEFGKKFGENLYQFSRGIDNRALVFDQLRKSVSADVNYGIRFNSNEETEIFLRQLSKEVHSRLIDIKAKGKRIALNLMIRDKNAPVKTPKFLGHGVCVYNTKSVLLPSFTSDLNLITKTVISIIKSLNIKPNELRGIGIQITNLCFENKMKAGNSLVNMFSKAKNINDNKFNNSSCLKRKEIQTIHDSNNMNNGPDESVFSDKEDLKIDLDVLNHLPIEIRDEIINGQHLYKQIKEKPSTDVKIIEKNVSDANLLLKPDWRDMLKAWIESTTEPEYVDIAIITKFSNELVIAKKWEQLYVRLRFFQRIIEDQNEHNWHKAFNKLLNNINKMMMQLFKLNLYVKSNLNCCL